MTVPVTIIERRVVEISARSAADVAERVIREQFNLGDATTVEGGRLATWLRDERSKPYPVLEAVATSEQVAALHVAMKLRLAWQTLPAP
jgi:hypothetical protein